MEKVRIGIVGIRGFGASHVKKLKANPKAELVALCDTDSASLAGFSRDHSVANIFTDYKKMLELGGLDAVVLATPHFLHFPMVMDALKAGKHVLCEKPLAITSGDACAMAESAEKKNLTLACNYSFRAQKSVKMLHALIKRNSLGDIYYADMVWHSRWTEFMFDKNTTWRTSKEKAGGGILIGRGSHLIDSAWYLLGKPDIKSVCASCSSALTGMEVDDFAQASLRLANGVSVSIACSYVLNAPDFDSVLEMSLYGTGGGASFRSVDDKETFSAGKCSLGDGKLINLLEGVDISELGKDGPENLIDDFVASLIEKRTPCVPGKEAAYITKLIEACYRSASEKREIVL
jgi:predicted dehydrogenase